MLNLHASYQVTKNFQLFALVENAFNATYYTFGTFSPTSSVPIVSGAGRHQPARYCPGRPDRNHLWHPRDLLTGLGLTRVA